MSMLRNASLPVVYGVLITAQAAHSAGEVIMKLYTWLPWVSTLLKTNPVEPVSEETFLYMNLVVIAILLIFIPLSFKRNSLALFLFSTIAIVEMANGIMHIAATVYFGRYFPGVVSAIPLLLSAVWLYKKVRYVKAVD